MTQEQPNHEPDAMSFRTDASHDRIISDVSVTGASGSGRKEQRDQLTAEPDTSHRPPDPTHHGIRGYDPSSVPSPDDSPTLSPSSTTPMPTSPSTPSTSTHLSDDEVRDHIFDIIMIRIGRQSAEWYESCPMSPPITTESLAELDMPRIINNPKLRHDVNFDRELHFRPNLDGPKGKQKMEEAAKYWKALEAEFVLYEEAQLRKALTGQNDYWDPIIQTVLKRLPGVFLSVRDILQTLVPDYDQKAVLDRLDVDHIIQEIRMGVCDLIDLGNWLAKILKTHCAPMRDVSVDAMQSEILAGAANGRPDQLVNGLRQLLGILEMMKLDVANHQIRHMRPLLIEDTVNFQRRYNSHRIKNRKILPHDFRAWLQDATYHLSLSAVPPSPVEAIVSALAGHVLFNELEAPPPTPFYLDVDRLRCLRLDLHTLVYHGICEEAFLLQITSRCVDGTRMLDAFKALHESVAAVVGSQGRFFEQRENVAAEIVRVTLEAERRSPPFCDARMSEETVAKLDEDMRLASASFQIRAQQLFDRLVPKVQLRVAQCLRMKALDLQHLLVPPTPSHRHSLGFGAVLTPAAVNAADPDDDFVRRFAHMIVLHWQVWADLVYDEDDVSSSDTSGDDRPTPPSQAVTPSGSGAAPTYASTSDGGASPHIAVDVDMQSVLSPASTSDSQQDPNGSTESSDDSTSSVDSPPQKAA